MRIIASPILDLAVKGINDSLGNQAAARSFHILDTVEDHRYAALAIVTGRNHKLKAQFEVEDWSFFTFIYGFTYEMPNFMRSVDILITKAGHSTISEAFISVPLMIL